MLQKRSTQAASKRVQLRRRVFFALTLAIFNGVGCATSKPGKPAPSDGSLGEPLPQDQPAAVASDVLNPPQETFGPNEAPSVSPADRYGPDPVYHQPISVALVGGSALGFSHVGALRALKKAKIPIGEIFGSDLGGLVAALYAMEGHYNHVEWAMLRFRGDVFPSNQKAFLPMALQKRSRTQALEAELLAAFKERKVEQTRVPLFLAQCEGVEVSEGAEKKTHECRQFKQGLLREVIRQVLYTSRDYSDPEQLADSTRVENWVSWVQAQAKGPLVFVDATQSGIQLDHPGPVVTIRPEVQLLNPMAYERRSDIAFLGVSATEKQMSKIRQLVGLPQSSERMESTQ